MTKEKKIITAMTIILILLISIFSYFLINKNAIIEKQAEKIELQAMETNGSNSYVTTENHLKETSKNATVYYLGRGTSFDLSSFSGFENLTTDNFIVGGLSAPDTKTGRYTTGAGNVEDRAAARGFSISKSYDNKTGKLVLSGTSQVVQIHKNSTGYNSWASIGQNIVCFAYLVIGDIQNI